MILNCIFIIGLILLYLFKYRNIYSIDLNKLIYTDGQGSGYENDVKETEKAKQSNKDVTLHEPQCFYFTFKDYERHPAARDEYEYIIDTRKNSQYYKEYLYNDCLPISLFTKTSYADPTFIRFVHLVTHFSIIFSLNAMMFSDEYIDNRISYAKADRVKYNKLG